jgi:nucleolar protein 58
MLAAKSSLAIRVDALGEETDATMGIEQRADLEKKFAILEQNAVKMI